MDYINLYAYFQNNLGDDLMVEALISRFPKQQFYTERKLKSITHLQYKNLFGTHNTKDNEKSFKCSVLIGGSVFMQRDMQTQEQVDNRIKYNDSYLTNGPLFVIGANFGEYYTDYFKTRFKEYFEKCAGVCFRDSLSYNIFSRLPRVTCAPDVVFGYKMFPRSKPINGLVLISVVSLSNKYGKEHLSKDYENLIARLCKHLLSIGKTPLLMSFCRAEGDEDAIHRIIELCGGDNRIKTYFYNGDVQAALAQFSLAESVVSTRFHSAVLAMVMKKPLYAISYDTKIDNLFNDLRCKNYVKISALKEIDPKTMMTKMQRVKVRPQIRRAKRQFRQLEKYLTKHKRGNYGRA